MAAIVVVEAVLPSLEVSMLEMCTAEELNRPSSMGDRPAHYAVSSWALEPEQCFVLSTTRLESVETM